MLAGSGVNTGDSEENKTHGDKPAVSPGAETASRDNAVLVKTEPSLIGKELEALDLEFGEQKKLLVLDSH